MKTNNGEHPWGDTGQLILFLLFMVLWAADSFFLAMSTFLSGYVPLYFRLIVMILAMIIAAYLAKSGHAVASREHRPAGVVATGAFRYVRHPLYLASLLFYFGLAVSTACLFSFGLLLVMFFFYDYIASYEEKVLEGVYAFQDEYGNLHKETNDGVQSLPCENRTGRRKTTSRPDALRGLLHGRAVAGENVRPLGGPQRQVL